MASLNPLQGALGQRRAAHLLRRTSYRYTKAKVDEMATQTAEQALDSLLKLYPLQSDQPIYIENIAGATPIKWLLPLPGGWPAGQTAPEDFVLRRWVMTWWTNEAYHDPGIGHKMAMFFHQYLIVTATSGLHSHFFDYLSLLRWGSLGNFKKLAHKIVTDNCMLRYLNNQQNTKRSPNENFAREFFELFTILKGAQIDAGNYTNYTEDDIIQAARIFTGFRVWADRRNVDRETGIPRGDIGNSPNNAGLANLHDVDAKTFSDSFGKKTIQGGNTPAAVRQELSDFVDMVFAQPETAKNLCRRLYRYFVNEKLTDEVEKDVIAPLAQLLIASDFEVKPVLAKLLQSEHFFDADDSNKQDEAVGGMIKAPMELMYQTMNFFNMTLPDINTKPGENFSFFNRLVLGRFFAQSNFPLFFAQDVAGYPAYHQSPDYSHQWFNSSTIIARYKLGETLLNGIVLQGFAGGANVTVRFRVEEWLKTSNFVSDPSDAYVLVKELLTYLLPEEVDADRFEYFYKTVFLDNLPPADWTYEWQRYITTNDPAEVRIALGRLIKTILYAQEYQTL